MKTIKAIQFLAVAWLMAAFAGCESKETAAAGGGLKWTENFDAALQESANSGKPVMVDFFATWCGPCKLMDRQTYVKAEVISESEQWICVRVDVDKNAALAQRYNIEAVPTLVFIHPKGRELQRIAGFATAGELSATMKVARERLRSDG